MRVRQTLLSFAAALVENDNATDAQVDLQSVVEQGVPKRNRPIRRAPIRAVV